MCQADFLGNDIVWQPIDFSNDDRGDHTRSILKQLTSTDDPYTST